MLLGAEYLVILGRTELREVLYVNAMSALKQTVLEMRTPEAPIGERRATGAGRYESDAIPPWWGRVWSGES